MFRGRITSLIWAKLNHYMLGFFLKIKNNHILTMCPNCLQEQYKEAEKCQNSGKNKDFELGRDRVFNISFVCCFVVNIF